MKQVFKILVYIFAVIGLLFVLGIGALFIPGLLDKLNDLPKKITTDAISEKERSERTAGDKFFLFSLYIDDQNIPEALKMAADLESHVKDLRVDQGRYVAAHAGLILMADGQGKDFDKARATYEIFLKDQDPAYYHFFMSTSYMQEGDLDAERRELMEAKKYPLDPKLEQHIENRLKA